MAAFHSVGVALLCAFACPAGTVEDYVAEITPLVSQTNTADVIPSQFSKTIYWLTKATQDKADVSTILTVALGRTMTNVQLIELTRKLLTNNLNKARLLGCTNESSLNLMRQGLPPIIQTYRQVGKPLAVSAVIPSSICPELKDLFANYEFNVPIVSRSPVVTKGERNRQQIFADAFLEAGVLSAEGHRRFVAGDPPF